MARCSGCAGDRCSCVVRAGANVQVVGAGTSANPYLISADPGGGGGGALPTGAIIMWGASGPPTGWLVANGAAVSRITYQALFNVIGTIYGAGDGSTTFNLPDLAGRFPLGADAAHPIGSALGAEAVTLLVPNLPQHTHTFNHTHQFPHDHVISHDHGGGGSSTESVWHQHGGGTDAQGAHNHSGDKRVAPNNWPPNNLQADVMAGGNGITGSYVTSTGGGHSHNVSVGNQTALHTHSVAVPAFSGWTSGSNNLTTWGAQPGTTDVTGSGQPFSIMPVYTAVTFLIKT